MSLLSRLFGKRQDDPYTSGVVLYEEGRFDEAIELLRDAAVGREDSPSGSLATFHLRGALVASGRRALRAGEPGQALLRFEEAASRWETFPDLQFLVGAACYLTGDLDAALVAAAKALRTNSDYCEARLLEACGLAAQDRMHEAADSLNKLLESGRRTDSTLLNHLQKDGGYRGTGVPDNLKQLLVECVGGDTLEDKVTAAVALCRGGRWQQGAQQMQTIVESRPGYPDLRLKLAGMLYQIESRDRALEELQEALRLKPGYRSALHLQALILAERQDFVGARNILLAAKEGGGPQGRAHEELFAGYLGAVLDLLTGRCARLANWLGDWGDLTRDFPYAELLMAAADELTGRPSDKLEKLVKAWPADSEYLYFRICQLLQGDDLLAAAALLAEWPSGAERKTSDRPLRLRAELALRRGDVPTLPPEGDSERSMAWRFLEVRSLALQKKWIVAFARAETMWNEGFAVEPLARELARAAASAPASDAASLDWLPPPVVATSTVPDVLAFLRRRGRNEEADGLLARHAAISPDHPMWTWLNPAFWLNPIRQWIA